MDDRLTISNARYDIVACLPVYREASADLRRTIDSFRRAEGPLRIHLTIILDGPDPATLGSLESSLYREAPRYLQTPDGLAGRGSLEGARSPVDFLFIRKAENRGKHDSHLLFLDLLARSRLDAGRLGVLLIDSDTSFPPDSLRILHEALWARGNEKVGAIAGRSSPRWTWRNLLTASQSFEYWMLNMLDRSFQTHFGSVTCLPGAFSLYKRSAILDARVLARYTRRPQTLLDHNKLRLGEDRYLTTLILNSGARTAFSRAAQSQTTPPAAVGDFLAQRRRWANSILANDLELISSRHPGLRAPACLALRVARATNILVEYLKPAVLLSVLFAFLVRDDAGLLPLLPLVPRLIAIAATAVALRDVSAAFVYSASAYLLLSPLFVAAPLLACARIDDVSWGTRGLSRSADAVSSLRSWARFKWLLFLTVVAANAAVALVLTRYPAVFWALFVHQILVFLPRLLMALPAERRRRILSALMQA